MRFTDKTVIVTGAGSGIGAATAARFASEGANVVFADLNLESAEMGSHAAPGSIAVQVDIASSDDLAALRDITLERFGRIDVLINNAAKASQSPFLEITPAELERDLAVNLKGPFMACQAVIPSMIDGGGGAIVNVSSVNAFSYLGNEAYSAAKAGLHSLTTSIANRFGADNIRCNAVAPGTVNSGSAAWRAREQLDPQVFERAARWYPLGRVGMPADIAAAILFLASDEASWISGAVMPVDGGLLSGNLAMARGIVVTEHGSPSDD